MIAHCVIGAKRIGLVIHFVAHEANELFLIVVGVDDSTAARPLAHAAHLAELGEKLYCSQIAFPRIVRVLDLANVVIVVELPTSAGAAFSAVLLQRQLLITINSRVAKHDLQRDVGARELVNAVVNGAHVESMRPVIHQLVAIADPLARLGLLLEQARNAVLVQVGALEEINLFVVLSLDLGNLNRNKSHELAIIVHLCV